VGSNAARESGTGQAKAVAARCLQSIGEDRPGPARIALDEHRRARSPPAQSSSVSGTSPPFRRGRGPPPGTNGARSGESGRQRGARTVRAGHATALRRAERRPVIGPSRRCPRDGRFDRPELPPLKGRVTRLAWRSRIEMSAIGSVCVVVKVPVAADQMRPGRQRCRDAACAAGTRAGEFRHSPVWAMAAAGPSEVCANNAPAACSYASWLSPQEQWLMCTSWCTSCRAPKNRWDVPCPILA
jgi:hypothetical protein